jgi:hypothetical protein
MQNKLSSLFQHEIPFVNFSGFRSKITLIKHKNTKFLKSAGDKYHFNLMNQRRLEFFTTVTSDLFPFNDPRFSGFIEKKLYFSPVNRSE